MPAGIYKIQITLWSMVMWLILPGPALAELSMQQAVEIAMRSDPQVNQHLAKQRGWQLDAVAENQLPDPKLRLGLSNVPLDTYDLEQEPMTQANIGIEQRFPRGDTLELEQDQANIRAQIEQLNAELVKRELVRDVRLAYLNLYREVQSAVILEKSRILFKQILEITQSQYGQGRSQQQDVLRAELELARLQDRETKVRSQEDEARAMLAKWIGNSAWQNLPVAFPQPPAFIKPESLDAVLMQHPAIASETAKINAQQYNVKIAEQQYSPGFSLGLDYRKRFGNNPDGSQRSDMMAIMANIDLPVFTENRQDKRVAASQEQVNAAHYQRSDVMRNLKRVYQSYSAQLLRLQQRQQLYTTTLLKAARETTTASIRAYQSGVTEFNSLMRVSITELDVMFDALRVDVDVASAQVQLDYITGESQ